VSEAQIVRTDVADEIGTITLNRPEVRNALSPEMLRAITHAVTELDRMDLAAIILTGADPAFCAGVDLKRLSSGDTQTVSAQPRFWGALPPHDTPIIGAINGATVTGGFELALACDFLIASDRARFADTHARVGVMPGWGLTIRLPSLIGIDRARRMSFTGDFLDAATAYEWGLVTEVVPHDALLTRAREIASHMATVPRRNLRAIRGIYAEMGGLLGEEAWAHESQRSHDWMTTGFDQARLAADRAAIMERGRGFVDPS
jgi:enoyl-CoA hydratase/carnithine racemase